MILMKKMTRWYYTLLLTSWFKDIHILRVQLTVWNHVPGSAWQSYNRKPSKWSQKAKAQMYKMAVNTCEAIRSNRRIQQLVTLNWHELHVKSLELFGRAAWGCVCANEPCKFPWQPSGFHSTYLLTIIWPSRPRLKHLWGWVGNREILSVRNSPAVKIADQHFL